MGMTVEEQVVMLGEQIKLKIGLDELGEEKRELDHSLKKAKYAYLGTPLLAPAFSIPTVGALSAIF